MISSVKPMIRLGYLCSARRLPLIAAALPMIEVWRSIVVRISLPMAKVLSGFSGQSA